MADAAVVVEDVTQADDETVAALARLYPQIRRKSTADREGVARFLSWPGCTLYVARISGEIVGTVALVIHPGAGSGMAATIWSLVVDEAQRRQGIGSALLSAALEKAKRSGARRCSLRSAATREAAHALYLSAGFEQSSSPNFDYYFS